MLAGWEAAGEDCGMGDLVKGTCLFLFFPLCLIHTQKKKKKNLKKSSVLYREVEGSFPTH